MIFKTGQLSNRVEDLENAFDSFKSELARIAQKIDQIDLRSAAVHEVLGIVKDTLSKVRHELTEILSQSYISLRLTFDYVPYLDFFRPFTQSLDSSSV